MWTSRLKTHPYPAVTTVFHTAGLCQGPKTFGTTSHKPDSGRIIAPMDREPTDSGLAGAEKHVADDIEAAIDVPTSIEAEAMLEAAELEELEAD
jgi:hypothetical protein